MSIVTVASPVTANRTFRPPVRKRIESIDLLRGIVMIIMAIDHVRDYFHRDAFLYDPTDLDQTTPVLFFTRFITHYCAPIFVFLAGISAYLYGSKRSKRELSFFLFTRGVWLALAEMFIISLELSFNPTYPFFNLQVIWAIGISMIALSAIIHLNKQAIIVLAILLIAGHNLLDNVHFSTQGHPSFLWALLHDTPTDFTFGQFKILIHYPVLPWIGIISLGYCFGSLYNPSYDPEKRKRKLLYMGLASIALFIILKAGNFYGDSMHWSVQKNRLLSFLSFLKVTKYPPSLQYVLVTLGPALIFLSYAEKPLNAVTARLAMFGRVALFYYIAHLFLIHLLACIGAVSTGYNWSDMILTDRINRMVGLKGYGFSLLTVYLVWIWLIVLLYPFCRWFDKFKRANVASKWWLSYF